MSPTNRFSSLVEGIKDRASVQTVYGEPINRGGKTLIPVARVMFGFGGGEGEGNNEGMGAGMGGGGGLMAHPLGMYEIDADGETNFIPLNHRRNLMRGIGIGMLLGLAIFGLLRRMQTGENDLEGDFNI